jgi:hypothetical protein
MCQGHQIHLYGLGSVYQALGRVNGNLPPGDGDLLQRSGIKHLMRESELSFQVPNEGYQSDCSHEKKQTSQLTRTNKCYFLCAASTMGHELTCQRGCEEPTDQHEANHIKPKIHKAEFITAQPHHLYGKCCVTQACGLLPGSPSPTSDRQVTITLHSLHGLDFPC